MADTVGVVGAILLSLLSTGVFYGKGCQAMEQAKETTITWQYEESVKEVCNPERGFYIQADVTDIHTHEDGYEPYYRLRLLTLNLSGLEQGEDIPDWKLQELRDALLTYRKQGMQVIFRAGYCFEEGAAAEPPAFDYIENHCRQICEILNEYSDVVLVVQAGFIGPFGEWHTSPYMKQTDENGKQLPIVLLHILTENLKEDIQVAVRSPMYLRAAMEDGIPANRLCFHNDAFLASSTDMGTYEDENYTREEELLWVQQSLPEAFNGGETTNLSVYTKVENAIEEMDALNISYLNRYYSQDVLDAWKKVTYGPQSAFTYINNHLGYRFSLRDITLQSEIYVNQDFGVSGYLRNSGFAKPREVFDLYVVWQGADAEQFVLAEAVFEGEDTLAFQSFAQISEEWQTEESVRVGICMTKDVDNRQNNSIEFANDTISYEDGIHWIATYEKEGDGTFLNPYRFVLCTEGQ